MWTVVSGYGYGFIFERREEEKESYNIPIHIHMWYFFFLTFSIVHTKNLYFIHISSHFSAVSFAWNLELYEEQAGACEPLTIMLNAN